MAWFVLPRRHGVLHFFAAALFCFLLIAAASWCASFSQRHGMVCFAVVASQHCSLFNLVALASWPGLLLLWCVLLVAVDG